MCSKILNISHRDKPKAELSSKNVQLYNAVEIIEKFHVPVFVAEKCAANLFTGVGEILFSGFSAASWLNPRRGQSDSLHRRVQN